MTDHDATLHEHNRLAKEAARAFLRQRELARILTELDNTTPWFREAVRKHQDATRELNRAADAFEAAEKRAIAEATA